MSPVIGFAGLTHLGINSQAAAAARGFNTVGYQPDTGLVECLKRGELPISEPGLASIFDKHRDQLFFSDKVSSLADCDLVYISVDVPTDEQGCSDLSPIKQMINAVVPALKDEASLVVLCQVPPGFTRKLPVPSKQLFYQVETLIFGRAIERAMYPERFILGCQSPEDPLPQALTSFLSAFDCPILPMRYESAELTKISINACLVASISVANTMADLCERVGADWDEIIPALKLDGRIGQFAYLKPGLGLAGGNLERDLTTVVKLADETGSNASVVKAWINDSEYRKNWVLRKLIENNLVDETTKNLGILGLAYKENTNSTKNSASIALLNELLNDKTRCHIQVFDPEVKIANLPIDGIYEKEDAVRACVGVSVVIIMTPWPEFKKLELSVVSEVMEKRRGKKWLIDPYRLFDPVDCEVAGLNHLTLGRA